MNDYTAKQLKSLEEQIAIKKAKEQRLMEEMREEADSSLNALRWYVFPAVVVSLFFMILIFACRPSPTPNNEVILAGGVK